VCHWQSHRRFVRHLFKRIHSRLFLGDDVPEQFIVSRGDIRLTFTGKAIKNAQGDGGASYDCIELPHLKAAFYKGKIQIDLPDLLDALKISWIADTNQNILD